MIQVLGNNSWNAHPSMRGALGLARGGAVDCSADYLSDAYLSKNFKWPTAAATATGLSKVKAELQQRINSIATTGVPAAWDEAERLAAAGNKVGAKIIRIAIAAYTCQGGGGIFAKYKWPLIGAGALLLGLAAWKFMK
jgi:hypothetical protein